MIRYNFIDGAQQGIYLDDWSSDCFVYGNIITGARIGITVHGGANNVVENNLIVNALDRGIGYWSNCCGLPEMVRMAGFGWGNYYRNNIIYNSGSAAPSPYKSMQSKWEHGFHLFAFWRPDIELDYADRELAESDYNLFYDSRGTYGVRDKNRNLNTLDEWRALGYDTHSLIADPLFVDPARGDYHLKPESPAFGLGFQPIPIERIGVRGTE